MYIRFARVSCLILLMHWVCCAFRFAEDSAGSNKAARMAMIAMTTRSSINVKPQGRIRFMRAGTLCFPVIYSLSCPKNNGQSACLGTVKPVERKLLYGLEMEPDRSSDYIPMI